MTRKVCPYAVDLSHAAPRKAMFWPRPLETDRSCRKPLVGSFEGSKQLPLPMPRRGMGDLHESIVAWRSGMMNTTIQFRSGERLQYTRDTIQQCDAIGRTQSPGQRSAIPNSNIPIIITPSAARKSKNKRQKKRKTQIRIRNRLPSSPDSPIASHTRRASLGPRLSPAR